MSQVRDELKVLYEIDKQLITIKRRLDAGPKERVRRQLAVDAAKQAKTEVETRIREVATGVDRFNLDIKSAEEEIADMQEKLHIIKNNKEYKIITERIKDLKQQIGQNEEKELEAMEALDAMRADLAKKQAALGKAEAACEEIEKEIEQAAHTVKDEQRGLVGQRKAQIAKVDTADPAAMKVYSLALRRGKGKALAILKNGGCQECFRQQTPNVINLVLLERDIDKCICAGCGRILFADTPLTEPEA